MTLFLERFFKRFCKGYGVVVMVALVGCSGGGGDGGSGGNPVDNGPDAVIGGVGRIAYVRRNDANGSYHLYLVGPDGKNLVKVIPDDDLADYSGMSWSADGNTLAFASNRNGNANFDIFTMNIDGSNLKTVVGYSGGDFAPSLSPDGTKIVFQASRNINTKWDIYVVNIDGSDEHVLIQTTLNEELPVWSPDGAKIAFQAGDSTGTDIYVANADGSNIRRLTDGNKRLHAAPAWSPDGTQIAFESNRHQAVVLGVTPIAEYEIYAINVDGSNLRRLSFGGGANSQVRKPTWSPDGKQIAFEFTTIIPNTLQPLTTIAIMNTDGSNVYVVPDLPAGCLFPRWSPVP